MTAQLKACRVSNPQTANSGWKCNSKRVADEGEEYLMGCIWTRICDRTMYSVSGGGGNVTRRKEEIGGMAGED